MLLGIHVSLGERTKSHYTIVHVIQTQIPGLGTFLTAPGPPAPVLGRWGRDLELLSLASISKAPQASQLPYQDNRKGIGL